MKDKDLQRLYKLADEADMIDDPQVSSLLKGLSIDPDEEVFDFVETMLSSEVHEKRMKEPFPDTPDVSGKFKIGQTSYGTYAGFSEQELNRHVLFAGASGTGKTIAFKNLTDSLSRHGITYTVVDVKGGSEYRESFLNNNDLILPWNKLRINPLVSPDWVSEEEWLSNWVDYFGTASNLLSASKNHLLSMIYKLKEIHPAPSIYELLQYMKQNRPPRYSKTANYHDTIINRKKPMVQGENNKIFDCSRGLPFDDLVERNVLLEVDGLGIDLRKAILAYLLNYIFLYYKNKAERGEGLQHIVFIDESRYLFSSKNDKNYDQDAYAFERLIDQVRAYGVGFVLSDQIPSKLSQSARANTGNKVIMRLSDYEDIKLLGDSVGLSEDQVKKAINLETGEAILKKKEKDPVKIEIFYKKPDRKVSDEEKEKRLKKQYQKLEEAVEPRYTTEEFDKVVKSNKEKKEDKKDKNKDKNEQELSEEAESLLKDINFNPLANLTDRYNGLELSRNKGTKAVKELEEGGFAKSVQINKGRGGRPKFFDLTDKGRNYLQKLNVEPTPTRGRGNIRHTFWQKRSQEFLQEHGYSTFLEHRNADVFGEKDGHKVGVEIVTRKDYDLSNVAGYIKDLKTDRFIVATDKKLLHILKDQAEKMNQNIRSKIRFCKFQEFSKSDSDIISDSSSS